MKFLLACFLVLTPLLVHEAGHWALLRRRHVRIHQLWLGLGPVIFRLGRLHLGMFPVGAAVVPDPVQYEALRPLDRLAVALAGPAASALYATALWAWVPHVDHVHRAALNMLAWLNVWMAGVNALPLPPFDGFQALCAWYEHRNRAIPRSWQLLSGRLGNGLLYSLGFYVLLEFFRR